MGKRGITLGLARAITGDCLLKREGKRNRFIGGKKIYRIASKKKISKRMEAEGKIIVRKRT